ncbi:MAG: polyprenyl synthetase family protein [bacterium]
MRLSELNLRSQIQYAVWSKGKRLRPVLIILSAESVRGNQNKVMSLALAFELVRNATLVRDDIIDGLGGIIGVYLALGRGLIIILLVISAFFRENWNRRKQIKESSVLDLFDQKANFVFLFVYFKKLLA